jgi:DnaK suppressor protein
MPTRKTLSPLHDTLLVRSANRRKKLAEELASLRDFNMTAATGDSADVAFDTSSEELSSRLAERDARELSQIERAAARVRQGLYGICEGGGEHCQKRIPQARLKARPHTTLCINCERESEKNPDWLESRGKGNWAQVFASEVLMEERRVNLSDLETDPSSKGYTTLVPLHFQDNMGFYGSKTQKMRRVLEKGDARQPKK